MKLRMEWIYRTSKGAEMEFFSEEVPAAQALLFIEDMERTGRMKRITLYDQFDSTWTIKELKSYLKGIETEPHNVTVYFDGGYDRETKSSGLGCVIYYEQNGNAYRLRRNAAATGLESNNEAEYAAMHLGLQELDLLGVHHLPVRFIGDSQVVIKHLNGEWPVIEQDLTGWADRIEAKLKILGIQAEFEMVPRKQNGEADRLATQALNGVEIKAVIELVED